MSDQGPYAGQPYAGQPPAAPPYPPQPYAPQPAPVPPKKRGWLVVLVVVLLVGCAIAACLGTFVFNIVREQAKTRDAVQIAEDHFNASTTVLEDATEDIKAFGESGDAESQNAADEQIRAARDEIAAARAAIEPLDDSEGKKLYLSSLDSATKALEGVQQMLGTLKVLIGLSDQVADGTAAVKAADKLLDSAIQAGNRRDYSGMRTKASSASKKYTEAITIFKSAHEAEPTAGLDTVVSYATLRKRQADLSVRMAADGKAGRTSSYNKLVDQQQKLDSQAEKTGEPAIVTDEDWFRNRVAEQQAEFEAAGTEADTLRAKALAAFDL